MEMYKMKFHFKWHFTSNISLTLISYDALTSELVLYVKRIKAAKPYNSSSKELQHEQQHED